jgi:hypothetical protein
MPLALPSVAALALRARQRAVLLTYLPSARREGGGIMVSYPELFQLLNLIVSIITLMVLIYDKKK